MANTIALFKAYIDLLDEVYKQGSLTSVLDGNNALAQQTNHAGEFNIPVYHMDGLGDYSRNDGYVEGSVTLDFETKKANYDRARKFSVNEMDNVESAGIAFGSLSSEFIRTAVVPEIDAFRFATYAGKAGNKAVAALADGQAWIDALSKSSTTMDNAEVPMAGRHLFITSDGLTAINNMDTTKSRAALARFSDAVIVPQPRFCSAITLKSGKTGEEAGGFVKATDGKDLNFMVITAGSTIQFMKNIVNKIITPAENQEDDRWKFFYHAYGIAEVYNNKVNGIYCHTAAA